MLERARIGGRKMRLSATYILIGINILVFAAETMAGGTENRETALKFGAM
jgi:hypothetical protein